MIEDSNALSDLANVRFLLNKRESIRKNIDATTLKYNNKKRQLQSQYDQALSNVLDPLQNEMESFCPKPPTIATADMKDLENYMIGDFTKERKTLFKSIVVFVAAVLLNYTSNVLKMDTNGILPLALVISGYFLCCDHIIHTTLFFPC